MYNTINENYRISFTFGNYTSHQRYSKRVVMISVNEPAFVIMFIPHYDTNKFPFPPFQYNLEYVGEKYYTSDRRRILGFLEGNVIFFEHNEKAGQTFIMEYDYDLGGEIIKSHKLIYCLDTDTYNSVIKDLQKNFLYDNPNNITGKWKRSDVIFSKSMQFIDGKLREFKELLPESVKKSLVL